MSERGGAARRTSSRRSFSENTLPQDYLERLEQKRKQLDESIHKYIAAKEREYKNFEKELKLEHKLSQGQDGENESQKWHHDQRQLLESQQISTFDALSNSSEGQAMDNGSLTEHNAGSSPQDRWAMARVKDRRISAEREKDLAGLFTPAYLKLLEDKNHALAERRTSDPLASSTVSGEQPSTAFARANSDSMAQGKPKRPSQLVLAQRTSSSGSSADGKLASAMRSPSQRPKRKRVSLAVGDSIVAPSDNVPMALAQNTTPSHSRKRSQIPEKESPLSVKRPIAVEGIGTTEVVETSAEQEVDVAVVDSDSITVLPQSMQESSSSDHIHSSSRNADIDPDGDLFDLEDEEGLGLPAQPSLDDTENALESDDDDEIAGRVNDSSEQTIPSVDPSRFRYDPTTGVISEPEDEKTDSAVPYLAFGPSSAVAPLEPGFRRPSVVQDPVYRGPDYQEAERSAVENDLYGSTPNRPSKGGSFTPGSLGESYMAQHAEEMMRLKLAAQQTRIKSS